MASEAVARRNRRHFVPVDEAPGPGLSSRAREVVALLVIGVCLYLVLSLSTFVLPAPMETAVPRGGLRNTGGVVGHYLAHGLLFVFGFAAYLLVGFGLLYGMLLILQRPLRSPQLKALGAVAFTALVALLLAGPSGLAGLCDAAPYGAGGRLGANLSPKLQAAFGGAGRLLLLIFGALVSLMLATEWLLTGMVREGVGGVGAGVGQLRARLAERRGEADVAVAEDEEEHEGEDEDEDEEDEEDEADEEDEEDEDEEYEEDEEEEEDEEYEDEDEEDEEDEEEGEEEDDPGDVEETGEDADGVPEPAAEAPPPAKPARRRAETGRAAAARSGAAPARRAVPVRKPQPRRRKGPAMLPFVDADYPFPPHELFREPVEVDDSAARSVIEQNARAIERRLGSFKIGAAVVGVSQGPAVTQYELRLEEGIKVSRINSYEADLAAALRAVSVRVVAPIPGRDTIGIEVPNEERQMVVMRELLDLFGRAEDQAIPLFLGKDVAGEPIVEDLARMPHLLIAGTTGSGKSVCINAILLSVLMTRTPRQVRLVLIDPKMVELQHFKAVPHLACEVVTNMKKAPGVLEWAVEEMEKRYALFSSVGVNHIRSYNKLGQAELERRLQRPVEPADVTLPYQVVVIDELADLMAVAHKEVEESIQRLAQKSRAVGLHVILATQRPSTDVITGVIKANLPCQIAFKVNRKIDSRVILDSNGAEKLLGHGDMLYVPPGAHRVLRAQGAFVSDEEMLAVVAYLEQHGPPPAFIPDLVQSKTGSKRGPRDRDDLYDKAAEVVLGQQRGSATLLQRALSVGYTRATRLLEMMEEDGIVGPFVGSKSRDVLLTLEEWQEREAAIEAEMDEMDAEDQAGGGEWSDGAEAAADDEGLDEDPGAGDEPPWEPADAGESAPRAP